MLMLTKPFQNRYQKSTSVKTYPSTNKFINNYFVGYQTYVGETDLTTEHKDLGLNKQKEALIVL